MTELVKCTEDLEPFYEPLGLYLKPCAKINISICLPQLKQPGQSISNWDLMERIKKAVHPVQLSSIRVTTSTTEMVRFEAELLNRKVLSKVIKALDGYSLKVIGFFESLKVRAAEAKSEFPTRHDWDEFFRYSDEMNELKAGERPDTIYLGKVPSNWFKDDLSSDVSLPSEHVLRRVFEQFGDVRCVDIPVCDRYRKHMPAKISGIRTTGFSFGQEVLFEGYVQFSEYISFVRAMDTLRNMKLVKRVPDGRTFEASIKVDFDKTKHLSDKYIRKRELERERLREEERAKQEEELLKRKEEEEKRKLEELQRDNRRLQREQKRRLKRHEQKCLMKKMRLDKMIAEEERKLVEAKRRLESRRLLAELFRRIDFSRQKKMNEEKKQGQDDKMEARSKHADLESKLRQALLREQEVRMRKRIEAKMLLRMQSGTLLKVTDGCRRSSKQKSK